MVHALLDLEDLRDKTGAVRLAVLVLASRTPSETGVVEIRTPELGRWLGLSASYTASVVVPALRRSGVVSVETAPGDFGQDVGLKCRVLPLWAAQDVVGHPLALAKKEYATLLRLLEAVMAPGWTHRDGRVTPAGLIGTRTGRGAATDRLALLLLLLEARETGRVRQCGGAVDTKRGRAAATVARMLGCTAAAGERVLKRLEDLGLVLRVRLKTGSGMPNRSRLMVPAVTAAHGRTIADGVQEDRAGSAEPESSGPDAAAGPGELPEKEEEPQVSGMRMSNEAGVAEPDVAAALHTDHPHLVASVVDLPLSGGFSGEARGGEGRQPERACAGEDQAADRIIAGDGSSVAEGGPLRGEQPKESPVDERDKQAAAEPGTGGRPKAAGWEKPQQQRRMGLPGDLRLRAALGPASWLWERLSGWQQDQVEAAAKAELARMAGLGVAPEGAPRLLADRITGRLEETGGEAMVTGPYGWLIRRGLPQRPACSDRRCDDGTRLDNGAGCENCASVLHLRRARRARIGSQIDRELPGVDACERRRRVEERLREVASAEAQDLARRQEQAREQEARRTAGRAAAQQRAEIDRGAAAAADAERQAVVCEDCGRPRSAGLCEACGYRRRTEEALAEACLIAATWGADLRDPGDVAAVARGVRASLEQEIADARTQYLSALDPAEAELDPAGTDAVLAYSALRTVEESLPEFRNSAVEWLRRTEEADEEARRASRIEKGRRWFRHNPHGADAVTAAAKAADTARERTAQHLLAVRLEQLREQSAARTERAR
ncbi:hypothetical protein [Streptomyces rubiginosohelvolus]|uniref:hypothetical protein n=1 Tax=Streptomyces rubiginosohelvolus TaxID=67362 RepID=UPI0035D7372B